MMKLAPLHVGISVRDMEESIAWYRDTLGFEVVVSDEYVAFLKARVVFISNGNFEIELFQHDESKALPPERRMPNEDLQTQGTKHIAFCTADLKPLLERFEKNGVDLVMHKEMNGVSMCFVRDPSGVLVEIMEKPDF